MATTPFYTFAAPTRQQFVILDSSQTAKIKVGETIEASSGTKPGAATVSIDTPGLIQLHDFETNHGIGYIPVIGFNAGGTAGNSAKTLGSNEGRLSILLFFGSIESGSYTKTSTTLSQSKTSSFRVQSENTSNATFDEPYPGSALWFGKTGGNFRDTDFSSVYSVHTDYGSSGGITYDETTGTFSISKTGVYSINVKTDFTRTGQNTLNSASISVYRINKPSQPLLYSTATSFTIGSDTAQLYVSEPTEYGISITLDGYVANTPSFFFFFNINKLS